MGKGYGICAAVWMSAATAMAAPPPLIVNVEGVKEGQPIPPEQAYCISDAKHKSKPGPNQRPTIRWTKSPYGSRSFVVVIVDPDVPTDFSQAGKEGRTIARDMKRQDFYHMVQVDIPINVFTLEGNAEERPPLKAALEGKAAVNDYAKFSDTARAEDHLGYDGPCPPWNDMRVHRYHYRVYALDVGSLKLPNGFTAKEAMEAMQGHVLAMGERTGTYTLNDGLK